MKLFFLSLFTFILMVTSAVALALNGIMEETKAWKEVPIKIDTKTNTYTIVGIVPEGITEYYYSYPGYRCLTEKKEINGVNILNFNSAIGTEKAIYCYPE